MTLEDIGEGDDALLCKTIQTGCCRSPLLLGDWFFPNQTAVCDECNNSDFYSTRDQMEVRLQRRRGGEEGIYHCEIPDAMNVTQTIYVGVYPANTSAGE